MPRGIPKSDMAEVCQPQQPSDGSTPEKAIIVDSVVEEYQWLRQNCPGYTSRKQTIQHVIGKHFDLLEVIDGQGVERKFYFDISRFFELIPADWENGTSLGEG